MSLRNLLGDWEQPHREELIGDPRLQLVANALAESLLSRARDASSTYQEFSQATEMLATLLLMETCRDLPLRQTSVHGFSGELIDVQTLQERVAGVAILRAGLIFAPGFRALLPDSPLYHIGIKRDEETFQPGIYSSNIPIRDGWADRVLILDPMLATGGTACKAIELVRDHYSGTLDLVCLVAAPLGVQKVLRADEDCRIVAVALDDRLNESGYIVPGLGDAGDRHFGTAGE